MRILVFDVSRSLGLRLARETMAHKMKQRLVIRLWIEVENRLLICWHTSWQGVARYRSTLLVNQSWWTFKTKLLVTRLKSTWLSRWSARLLVSFNFAWRWSVSIKSNSRRLVSISFDFIPNRIVWSLLYPGIRDRSEYDVRTYLVFIRLLFMDGSRKVW